MVKQITRYLTSDGKEFNSLLDANEHERELEQRGETQFLKFKNTWNYNRLMESHSSEEYGLWEVRGEDPNCDMGGHHHEPYLATFEGKLEDVIREAVKLPGFWHWGAGGSIRLVEPKLIRKLP